MQIELKALQEQVGITFIYVTHDQDEALTMSDRIAVMNQGRVEQVGTPREIYEAPETVFVADFLGASNLMDATARGADGRGRCRVEVGGRELAAALGDTAMTGACKVIIRPERVRLEKPGPASDTENRVAGTVERSIYIGSAFQLIVRLDIGCTIEVEIQNTGSQTDFEAGSEVSACLPPEALRVLRNGGDTDSVDRDGASPGNGAAPDTPAEQRAGQGLNPGPPNTTHASCVAAVTSVAPLPANSAGNSLLRNISIACFASSRSKSLGWICRSSHMPSVMALRATVTLCASRSVYPPWSIISWMMVRTCQ